MDPDFILTDTDRKVYETELRDRLPDRIFDAHVHLLEKKDFPAGFQFKPKAVFGYFQGEFSVQDWEEFLPHLLPGKEVYYNAFNLPHNEVDRNATPRCRFNMSLISPRDPVEQLQSRMEKSRSIGVKPYWYYSGKSAAETQIMDMMTAAQLKMLNDRKAVVTFHIPRPGRFEDPLNQRQMVQLCEEYPDVTFIFAHIGRAYYMQNIRLSNLEELSRYPNCYFDTAMLNHKEVFQYTLDHFPAERILFGTDAPIALLHGKSVEVNNSYLYLCAEDCLVGTMAYVPGMREVFTLFYYEQLRALLESVPETLHNKIFFENAWKLFTEKEAQL